MQLIHHRDLTEAIVRATLDRARGVLNIASRGVVPLSRMAALSGRLAPALPYDLALRMAPEVLGAAPLRWRCVADTRRVVQVLGFSPSYTAEEAIVG